VNPNAILLENRTSPRAYHTRLREKPRFTRGVARFLIDCSSAPDTEPTEQYGRPFRPPRSRRKAEGVRPLPLTNHSLPFTIIEK